MGTPYYMAPEQVLGKNIGPLVDVYAFGVLLFELMTGSRPIVGDTVERIFYQILQEPLNTEPMRQAGIPEPIIDLVRRCTEKDSVQRPQGFGEVCARIRAIIHDWDATTRPMKNGEAFAPPPPARKPWLIPAVAAAMLIVLGGAYLGVRTLRAPAAGTPQKTEPPPKAVLKPSISTPTGTMVLVVGSPFLFGKDKQSVTLPAFYIDEAEVTYDAYARFCAAKGRPIPPGAEGERPEDPIVDVSFLDAREFAKWAGKRLPSTQEWEKAARGTDGRSYPWGNAAGSPPPANIENPKGVMQVHSNPSGASPYGAVNMVGNVWEWVDESTQPSAIAIERLSKVMQPPPTSAEPWFMIRGESYAEPLSEECLTDYAPVPARRHAKNIGFRCVKTP